MEPITWNVICSWESGYFKFAWNVLGLKEIKECFMLESQSMIDYFIFYTYAEKQEKFYLTKRDKKATLYIFTIKNRQMIVEFWMRYAYKKQPHFNWKQISSIIWQLFG